MHVEKNEIRPAGDSGRSMWLVVVVVFGLMVAAWVTMFTIALRNPIESVPLEHRATGPSGAK